MARHKWSIDVGRTPFFLEVSEGAFEPRQESRDDKRRSLSNKLEKTLTSRLCHGIMRLWHPRLESFLVSGSPCPVFLLQYNSTRRQDLCFDLNIEARAVRRERKGLHQEAI